MTKFMVVGGMKAFLVAGEMTGFMEGEDITGFTAALEMTILLIGKIAAQGLLGCMIQGFMEETATII